MYTKAELQGLASRLLLSERVDESCKPAEDKVLNKKVAQKLAKSIDGSSRRRAKKEC